MAVKPIAEAIKSIKREHVNSMRYQATKMREAIRNIESNYQVIPLLQAAGVPVELWASSNLDFVVVRLGDRSKGRRSAKKVGDYLRLCRQILGPLSVSYTSVHNARRHTVEVNLRPKNYPGLLLSYINKLPTDSKCHIVTEVKRERKTSLVCSV